MSSVMHFLTGTEYSAAELTSLLELASHLSQQKKGQQLAGAQLALIFDKPSLRTRFSFTAAMRQLGGDVIESVQSTRKTETPADQMRVLQGYCDAVMVRTHADSVLHEMVEVASIPVINGLTELHHPCQILADLLTLQQHFGQLKGLTVAYLGDGNNILHSWLLLAPLLGVRVQYCCPASHGPHPDIMQQAKPHAAMIQALDSASAAVTGADAVYTDVWVSMGQTARDTTAFSSLKVDEALMAKANAEAVFMHCMPMNRGEEVSHSLPDSARSLIFQQSQNRLTIQKAILLRLLGEKS